MRAATFTPSPFLLHMILRAPLTVLSFQQHTSTLKLLAPPSERVNLEARLWRHRAQYRHHRHRSSSSSTTTTLMNSASSSSSSPSSSTTAASNSKILGGDYAGFSATFSAVTGDLVPVPEHLVPESMVEWGDIPSHFEVLSSEDWIAADDVESSSSSANEEEEEEEGSLELERTTITVLPEVGCGIDNLGVTKKSEKIGNDVCRFGIWQQQQQRPDREVVAIDRTTIGGHKKVDLETIFQVSPEVDDEDDGITTMTRRPRRIRVSLSVGFPKEGEDPTLSSSQLLTLVVERRTTCEDGESTRGTAWTGPAHNSGGLNIRMVNDSIGRDIVYGDVFAVKRRKAGGDPWNLVDDDAKEKDGAALKEVLKGPWSQTMFSPGNDDGIDQIVVPRSKGAFGEVEDTTFIATIRLPQGVMVRYGRGVADSSTWNVEVSHFGTISVDGKTFLQHRAVSRYFSVTGVEETGINSHSISYTAEEKEV